MTSKVDHLYVLEILADDVLGYASDDREPNQGARDRAAAAIHKAFPVLSDEFPNVQRLFHGQEQFLADCHKRCKSGKIRSVLRVEHSPKLALCAAIAEFGFVDSDHQQARRLMFCALVEMLSSGIDLPQGHLGNAVDGLRILIERAHNRPAASSKPDLVSIYDLFCWIEDNHDIRKDVRESWTKLQSSLIRALEGPIDIESEGPEEEETSDTDANEVQLVAVCEGVEIYQTPSESPQFAKRLPEDVETRLNSLLASRYASYSRFSEASPLMLSDAAMREEVDSLFTIAENNQSEQSQVVLATARLLSIASGMPIDCLANVKLAQLDREIRVPAGQVGLLSPNARWLIQPEFVFRTNARQANKHDAADKRIPIPPRLAALLLRLCEQIAPRKEVFGALLLQDSVPSTEKQSAWTTTLFGRLLVDQWYGPSLAQHALSTSFGIDIAPLYYDRIPAATLAQRVAGVTHPWFGDKAMLDAKFAPTHYLGSRRVKCLKDVKVAIEAYRLRYVLENAFIPRLNARCLNLLHGIVLSTGHRINDNFKEISLTRISITAMAATISDKKITAEHQLRLVALPRCVVSEIKKYIIELEHAVLQFPGTELAKHAAAALEGFGPLFLIATNPNEVRPAGRADYIETLPKDLKDQENFARHTLNDYLSRNVVEPIRVAQMGWTGTREGGFGSSSTRSAADLLGEVRPALEKFVKGCGWSALPCNVAARTLLSISPVNWIVAESKHRQAFKKRVESDKQGFELRLKNLERTLCPVVNAFFTMNKINLRLENGKIRRVLSASDPILVSKQMQSVIQSLMRRGRGITNGAMANILLRRWLEASRDEKVTIGPLPNRTVPAISSRSGEFLKEAPRSLDVVNQIRSFLKELNCSKQTRTYLAVMFYGHVASNAAVMASMDRSSKISALASHPDVLLVQPKSTDTMSGCSSGCLAFNAEAALALRAWHLSGENIEINTDNIRAEVLAALKDALAPEVTEKTVLEELEALMRAYHALNTAGVKRGVATGRLKPSFADIDRVVALHDDLPVTGRARQVRPSKLAGTRRKSKRWGAGADTFDSIVKRLRESLGSGGRRHAERKQLIAFVKGVLPSDGPKTTAQVLGQFVTAMLEGGGLRKEKIEISTILDNLYSVARPLMDATPKRWSLSTARDWESTYLNAVIGADSKSRGTLAQALAYFHKIMQRHYGVPAVHLGKILSLGGSKPAPEIIGVLTRLEELAVIACVEFNAFGVEQNGSKDGVEIAKQDVALLSVGLSSGLRPQEYRLPSTEDVVKAKGKVIAVQIHQSSGVALKTPNARRIVKLHGPASSSASEALAERVQSHYAKGQLRGGKHPRIFRGADANAKNVVTNELTGRVNQALQYVTGHANADTYLLRKTFIRRQFVSVVAQSSWSPWPVRNMLAEFGHASIETTINSYLHDPLALINLRQKSRIPTDRAAWILGMKKVSARRLLAKQESWLRPKPMELRTGSSFFELPELYERSEFVLDMLQIETLILAISNGHSVDSAIKLMHWPRKARGPVIDALEELRGNGLTLVREGSLKTLAPPRVAGTDKSITAHVSDYRSIALLSQAFGAWMQVSAIMEVSGIPATSESWHELMSGAPMLKSLHWERRSLARMTLYQPVSRLKGQHSPWPAVHWAMLCAWLLQRIRTEGAEQQPGEVGT